MDHFGTLGDGTHEVFTFWRVMNVVLGVVVLAVLIPTVRKLRGGFSNAGRTFINAHILLVAAVTLSAIESILQNHPIGARSALITAGLLFTLTSLVRQRRDQDTTGKVESDDG